MELVSFESKTYQELVRKIDKTAEYVVRCDSPSSMNSDICLDSNEVAELVKTTP